MTTPQKYTKEGQIGVKRNHFTPCRRIGLSRIIKTSSSTPKLKIEDETKSPLNVICAEQKSETKLAIAETYDESSTLKIQKSEELKVNTKREKENILKSSARAKQSKVSKTTNVKSTDDLQATFKSLSKPDSKEGMSQQNVLCCKSKRGKNEHNIQISSLKTDCYIKISSELHDNNKSYKIPLDFNSKKPVNDEMIESQSLKRNSGIKMDCSDKNKSCNINLKEKPEEISSNNSKTLKKRLSMKKSTSSNDNDNLEDSLLQLSNNVGSDLSFDLDEIQFKPKKRKMCISDDDTDLVTSQTTSEQNDNLVVENLGENLNDKIKEVLERIEKKELKLKNLQQAAIYKKLHDVTELKNLTELWKDGCQEALKYLLDSLQEHGPITMASLLKRLNIPPDFVTYNESEEHFV